MVPLRSQRLLAGGARWGCAVPRSRLAYGCRWPCHGHGRRSPGSTPPGSTAPSGRKQILEAAGLHGQLPQNRISSKVVIVLDEAETMGRYLVAADPEACCLIRLQLTGRRLPPRQVSLVDSNSPCHPPHTLRQLSGCSVACAGLHCRRIDELRAN